MKKILAAILIISGAVILLLIGGSMPERAAHYYFILVWLGIVAFIWFKRRTSDREHRARQEEYLREIAEKLRSRRK